MASYGCNIDCQYYEETVELTQEFSLEKYCRIESSVLHSILFLSDMCEWWESRGYLNLVNSYGISVYTIILSNEIKMFLILPYLPGSAVPSIQ